MTPPPPNAKYYYVTSVFACTVVISSVYLNYLSVASAEILPTIPRTPKTSVKIIFHPTRGGGGQIMQMKNIAKDVLCSKSSRKKREDNDKHQQ
jgi:hypothetical protein